MSEVEVLVDGVEAAGMPATDSSVLRGDGCFEAVRCYSGRLFRLDSHLDRLERSAGALGIVTPDRSLLRTWMETLAADRHQCVVRVVLTRGSAVPGLDGDGHCVVVAHSLPASGPEATLWPVPAPWHPAGRPWELAGVKTISYAPNLAAGRRAVAAGATDALLVSDTGVVLEGPTFSVGWVTQGRVRTPALRLGILDSITRQVVAELHPGLEECEVHLDELLAADEVFVMSTVKEITPVTAVGETVFAPGEVTLDLLQRFRSLAGQ